jgi:hypothetical protein
MNSPSEAFFSALVTTSSHVFAPRTISAGVLVVGTSSRRAVNSSNVPYPTTVILTERLSMISTPPASTFAVLFI